MSLSNQLTQVVHGIVTSLLNSQSINKRITLKFPEWLAFYSDASPYIVIQQFSLLL